MDESAETAGTAENSGTASVPRPDGASHDTVTEAPGGFYGDSRIGGRPASVPAGGSGRSGASGDDGWPDPNAGPETEAEPEAVRRRSAGGSGDDGQDGSDATRTRSAQRTWWQWALFPFAAAWRFAFPKKPRSFLVELPFLLAIALVLAFLIKTFLVQAFVIPSGSMQNTLEINDRVLVNRLANWMGDEPHRGDVVVFQDPGGWLDEQPAKPKNFVSKTLTAVGLLPEDNGDLIKRVIGVGGDEVACLGDGHPVTVNGVPLEESAYLFPGNQPSIRPAFDVVVPKGYLWVMGDHREVSQDSRPHEEARKGGGMVPVGNVVGVAVLKVWPPSHWGTLPVPATFKQSFRALSAPGAVPAAAMALALPITVLRRRRKLRKLRQTAES